MKELTLELSVPPTINHAYSNVRIGKRMMRVLTKDAKAWVETTRNVATKAVKEQHWEIPKDTQIVAEIFTWFPDRRRRDCHNGSKVLFDALEDIVYSDDKWVLPRYMEVSVDRENPRTIVRFYLKESDENGKV